MFDESSKRYKVEWVKPCNLIFYNIKSLRNLQISYIHSFFIFWLQCFSKRERKEKNVGVQWLNIKYNNYRYGPMCEIGKINSPG